MDTAVHSLSRFAKEHGRSAVGVLVLHDEELVHYGWRLLLSRQSWVSRCVTASGTAEAQELLRRYDFAVAVIDLDIGHERARETVAALREVTPKLAVLLVSGHTSISARAANFMGATGVVRKALAVEDLANAVLAVASGQRLFAIATPKGAGRLSDRETEVLGLMAAGATNREIAASLQVSPETVKRHAKAIFRKLDVRNRTEAAQRGSELGLGAQAAAYSMSA